MAETQGDPSRQMRTGTSVSSKEDESSELPPCPLVGCSIAFLDHFAVALQETAEHGSSTATAATMGIICNQIIKPITKTREGSKRNVSAALLDTKQHLLHGLGTDTDEKTSECVDELVEVLSFAELAMREGLVDSRGKPAFARATHFVSHAWRYVFGPFIDAIHDWISRHNVSQDETYFWVDAFVVNQHKSKTYPQEWWSTRFMQAVGEIGNTILVLDPWDNPVPLKRAWVIWELYCTTATGARLHITMRPETMEDFNKTLVTSFEKVQTALSGIDVESSEAFHRSDQEMIHNEIQRTIGFTKLNELIQVRLNQWLIETAKNRLQIMKGEEIGTCSIEPGLSRIKLADNLARMLRETGNIAEAIADFEELLTEVTTKLGRQHVFTLSCMNQLAVTYQKKGTIEKAMQIHRECLQHRLQILGPRHADSLQSISNLAVLVSLQKPLTQEAFEEAQVLFRQAISGREELSGPNHPTTLYTVSNLGKLLSTAPVPAEAYFFEAEALHQRAVQGLVENLHPAHPLTLTAMHNQACHWFAVYEFCNDASDAKNKMMLGRCMEQLHDVRNLRTEKLGKQHPDTLLTEQACIQCGGAQRNSSSHIEVYASWADLSVEVFAAPNTYDQFLRMRQRVRAYGVHNVMEELVTRGFVDPSTGNLTVGMQPFNIFARIAAGVQSQLSMEPQQANLAEFQDKFMVACNRPENDDKWDSNEPAWLGKASMSKRHCFLITKDLHWEWFNVLTFGLVSGLHEALRVLKSMKQAALLWASSQPEWSERVGLYLHVYAHSSVPSLHLHILDMDCVGPSYEQLSYKNLSIDIAIAVIETELREAFRATCSSGSFLCATMDTSNVPVLPQKCTV